jgi:myosin heavy subunit
MSGSQTVGAGNVDMATALELPLGTELEAKFVALRNLQLKKIKKLMGAIDGKDKEIAKLKILSKDNRRTQLIQALRNKIKDLELINDIVKEELTRKSEMATDEVNELIIRKTLGGPKRFRPLSREELENKILDLERRASSSNGGNTVSRKPADISTNAEAKSERLVAENKTSARNNGAASKSNAADEAKQYSNSLPTLIDSAALIDEVQNLRNQLATKEQQVGAQRDEIVRLRARNAELISLEEDMEFFEKDIKDTRDKNEELMRHVEQVTRQLAAANETVSKFKAENLKVLEEEQLEIEGLHKQCEKLLKQNATLLESLAEAEQTIQHYEEVASLSKTKSASTENLLQTKETKLKQMTEKNSKLEERVRQLEERVQIVEAEALQVSVLKEQLREKNIAIRDLKRMYEERAATQQQRPSSSSGTTQQSAQQAKTEPRSPSPPRTENRIQAPEVAESQVSNVENETTAEAKTVSPRPNPSDKGNK